MSKMRTQALKSLLGRRGAIFALLQFVSMGNESIFSTLSHVLPSDVNSVTYFRVKLFIIGES